MLVVKQSHEPVGFTSWFPWWSAEQAAQGKSFEELKKELSGGGGVTSVDEVGIQSFRHFPVFQNVDMNPTITYICVCLGPQGVQQEILVG
jgi:hypothetical protein